jgi:hypothetical protein
LPEGFLSEECTEEDLELVEHSLQSMEAALDSLDVLTSDQHSEDLWAGFETSNGILAEFSDLGSRLEAIQHCYTEEEKAYAEAFYTNFSAKSEEVRGWIQTNS